MTTLHQLVSNKGHCVVVYLRTTFIHYTNNTNICHLTH